jgi:membrane protein
MRTVRAALHVAWQFLRAAAKQFGNDMGSVLAGNIAYSLMLAVVPFLIFATALTGFIVGAEASQSALNALFSAVPQHVAETLKPVLLEVIGARRGGLLTLSALATIWAASNGVEAVRIGLDRAYDVDDARHVALSRLISIGVVLAGFAIFVVLSALIVFAPLVFIMIERWTPVDIPFEANLVRYFVGLTVLAAALWPMHRLLPSRSMRGLNLWPGILASVVIWGAAATGLSIYLAFAPSYTVTYGTLAGVIVTLLFFYLTGVALIFGAEVNAVVNAKRLAADRRGATRGPDVPPRIGG